MYLGLFLGGDLIAILAFNNIMAIRHMKEPGYLNFKETLFKLKRSNKKTNHFYLEYTVLNVLYLLYMHLPLQ